MAHDELYLQAAREFGTALERFVRSYEADPELRRDLLQEIHLAVWRSFAAFRGQCSLRTWVYRIAHNVSVSHVVKRRRVRPAVRLEELDDLPAGDDLAAAHAHTDLLTRMHALIRQLRPIDREVVLLYLEGLAAAEIGEITGIAAGNIATKVHRIKKLLAAQLNGGPHVRRPEG
jgi:RNA polymerase sigma-70 factor (ECF subfamily)